MTSASAPEGAARTAGGSQDPASRRDHHGRQRSLGPEARPSARRRAQGRRRSGAQDNAGSRRPRRRSADTLRILIGELAAQQRGDRRPHRPHALLPRARARDASQGRRQAEADRRLFGVRTRPGREARASGRATPPKPAADSRRRTQLRLAGRDRRGGENPRSRGGGGEDRPEAIDEEAIARTCRLTVFPSSTCSSARRARCACQTSCCGRPPMPS